MGHDAHVKHEGFLQNLGFQLTMTQDATLVHPLLRACGLEPASPQDTIDTYLIATTTAGGLAACVGWTLNEEDVVLHSLAVAPSTRGTGVGASLTATMLEHIQDQSSRSVLYLSTTSATRFFARFGFTPLDPEDVPEHVEGHPGFEGQGTVMVRRYGTPARGLDQIAFQIVENSSEDAVMPPGSLFFVTQSGQRFEASYKGGPVASGHLLGRIVQDEINYLWHAFSSQDELLEGRGVLTISSLEDGRRELRDEALVMREV